MAKPKKPAPNPAKELQAALIEALTIEAPLSRMTALQNALVYAQKNVTPDRARGLRKYLEAMLAVPLEHADGVRQEQKDSDGEIVETQVWAQPPIMTHKELVTVLLAGALFVHTDRILGRNL